MRYTSSPATQQRVQSDAAGAARNLSGTFQRCLVPSTRSLTTASNAADADVGPYSVAADVLASFLQHTALENVYLLTKRLM